MRFSPAAPLIIAAGVCSCAQPSRTTSGDLAQTAPLDDLALLADLSSLNDLSQAAAADLSRPDLLRGVDLGAIPQSWGSPSTAPTDVTLGWNGNYATGYQVALGADDPTALIYYTSDGSAPGLASTHAVSPITGINLAAPTRLRWFAATAAGMETPHDDNLDGADQDRQRDRAVDGRGSRGSSGANRRSVLRRRHGRYGARHSPQPGAHRHRHRALSVVYCFSCAPTSQAPPSGRKVPKKS